MIMRTHHMITLSFPAYRALSKIRDFLLPLYQGSVTEGLAKYFVISLRAGLHETQNSATEDALLTWFMEAMPPAQAEPTGAGSRGCPEQPSCSFSPAGTALRTAHAVAATHVDAPDAWQDAQFRYCPWAVKPTCQLRTCPHGATVNHTWTQGV